MNDNSAAVDGGELQFKPLADRIARRARRRTGLRRRGRRRRARLHLGKALGREREWCREQCAGKKPPGEGVGQRLQHIRPLKRFRGRPVWPECAADAHGAAKTDFLAPSVGSVTSFWRRLYGGRAGYRPKPAGFNAGR